jgi:hypothetical protein
MALPKCRRFDHHTQSTVALRETRDSRRELEFEIETESVERTPQVVPPEIPSLGSWRTRFVWQSQFPLVVSGRVFQVAS